MCKVQMLRALVKQRLTAAAEEIFGLFERTIAEYEEELRRSKEENERQRELLAAVFQPQLRLHRADVQQLSLSREEVPPEQQEKSPSLDQDPEPPHIKEEQEELWTSQEGEQLRGLEEADITRFPFAPVPVKSEEDEEKPQSSQLHQSQTEQMETGADGEDCGGPGPVRNSDPDTHLQPETDVKTGEFSVAEIEVSCDDWEETRDPQSGLNSLKNDKVSKSGMRCSTGKKPISCSDCGKKFGCKGNLKRHIRIHTGEKPFSCSVCGKRFNLKVNLKFHMRTHTGEKPFSCSVCGRGFAQGRYLSQHMAVHSEEKRYSCSVCDKRFTWGYQLKRHPCVGRPETVDSDGWKEKLFSCSECGKMFGSRGHLKRHIRVHTEEKPFSCSFCKKHFTRSDHMVRHMRIHTWEKPFSCSVCGKRFKQKATLQLHMRTHTGEKPFSCSVCSKSFTQAGSLTQHMSIHTGEKRYGCSVCDKRFTWYKDVKNHKCVGRRSSQLHQNQTEESREAEPPASSSAGQIETGADGEDCGGPGPARNSDPDTHLQPDTDDKTSDSSEPETEDKTSDSSEPETEEKT